MDLLACYPFRLKRSYDERAKWSLFSYLGRTTKCPGVCEDVSACDGERMPVVESKRKISFKFVNQWSKSLKAFQKPFKTFGEQFTRISNG